MPAGAAPPKACVGVYDDGEGGVETLWLADLPLTASLGAALTLIPPRVAEEAAKGGILSTDLLENAREVANIMANSFLKRRVRLVQFVLPGQALNDAAKALADKPGQRSVLQVDIAGCKGEQLVLVGQTLTA